MEKDKYYTVLYEAKYTDSGVISYKPVKAIKGNYNKVDEIFTEEGNDKMYACVNMSIPILGKDEEHLLDALETELEKYEKTEEPVYYFGFPIAEEKLIEYADEASVRTNNLLEFYEREARSYFLYSLYDRDIGDNVYYIVDKLDYHQAYNVGVNVDLVQAIIDAEVAMDDQQLLLVFSAEDTGEIETMQQSNKAITPETTMFTEIKFDFDPDELEAKVKAEVIGQDHVVTAVVSTLYRNKKYHEYDGLKSNIAILGPSGCGKTEIVRSISRHLDVPMTIFDASSATASGFVGTSVTQAIKDLISVCNGDIAKAEHGIIVIDEFDKLAQNGSESINKGDVQNELFKMLEGDEITIPGDSYKEQSFRFNPKNVTFICVGSGQELIDQKKKAKNKTTVGFQYPDNKPKKEDEEEEEEIILEPEDLIGFGIKPELLRRIPVVKVVKSLRKKGLVDILANSKISNLRLYEKAFEEVDQVKLVYNTEVLETIVEKSTKEKAGASGLKRVVDNMLEPAVRKIRLLEGAPGELVLSKETVEDPTKFELYKLDEQNKNVVYPPKEKVKTLGTIN